MKLFSIFRDRAESGQTMIFFAVLLSTLCMTTGLAVEGGNMMVQYRKMQSAADMSALIGAQKLPCGTADTTCITSAEQQACNDAASNGFASCTVGGAGSPSANVPPKTCSPYDFIDYGNGSSNPNCKSASVPTSYSYIEVRLQKNFGNVPIFNVPVTLSAHAVAKHGTASAGDYAIISLDPKTPLSIGGSATVQTVGSVFANGGISGGGTANTCDGGWYSAGTISNVSSDTSGTAVFAPTGCTPGSNDSSTLEQQNLAPINDPYAGSVPPPALNASYPNCPECSQPGWYYDLDGHTWYQDDGNGFNGSNLELFPGVYSSTFGLGNNNIAYFNPGVYTFTGGIDTHHGLMCVYGSPSCITTSCASKNFNPGDPAGGQWNYQCSPYGFWDSSSITGRPPSLSTVPTFYDSSLGSNSSVPLNGVTFYLPAGDPNITRVNGNSGKDGGVYLAAPDPCPGTGTYSPGSPGSVSFPAGSASGIFIYLSSNNPWSLPHGVLTSTPGTVYPSTDWSLAGECSLLYTVWPGEMPKPKHLHFLFYDLSSASLKINGASAQNMNGIFYAPNTDMSILGAGKGAGGPPWIYGQLIIHSGDFSGHSYNDVSYRACGGNSTACGGGAGTQLIQ